MRPRLQGVPVFEALGPVKLPAQVANKGESLQILLNITQKPVDLWLEQVKLFVKTCGKFQPAMRKNMKKINSKGMMQGAIAPRLPRLLLRF